MDKEVINQKQAILLMTTFIIGSTVVLGVGGEAKQDVWIAILLAMVMSCLIFIVYARIITLFPGKGLFDILDNLFGKILGRIISLLFIWYAFHLGALVIRNFTEFIHIVSLEETPQNFLALISVILVIWAIRAGVEVIGRWIAIFFPIMVITVIIHTLLTINLIEVKNLEPVLYYGLQPVFSSAFSAFAFPFAETVLFLTVLGNLRKNSSPYKVYFLSLLIGGSFILLIALRTIMVLGIANSSIQLFPSYRAIRLISVGNFIQRMEILIGMAYTLSGFIKCCICLYAVTKGIASIFNIEDYHKIVAPFGLLMALFSGIIYSSSMEMVEWATDLYKYYAIPFQIILPIIILITAEIKTRMAKKSANVPETESK